MARLGHEKTRQIVTYLCSKCHGDLELRKVLPGKGMFLVCKKSRQLPKQADWENTHTNFTDDCGFRMAFKNKDKLERR